MALKDAIKDDAGYEERIPTRFDRLPQVRGPLTKCHQSAAFIGMTSVDQCVGDQDCQQNQKAGDDSRKE